jgi:hypothetical protein
MHGTLLSGPITSFRCHRSRRELLYFAVRPIATHGTMAETSRGSSPLRTVKVFCCDVLRCVQFAVRKRTIKYLLCVFFMFYHVAQAHGTVQFSGSAGTQKKHR